MFYLLSHRPLSRCDFRRIAGKNTILHLLMRDHIRV